MKLILKQLGIVYKNFRELIYKLDEDKEESVGESYYKSKAMKGLLLPGFRVRLSSTGMFFGKEHEITGNHMFRIISSFTNSEEELALYLEPINSKFKKDQAPFDDEWHFMHVNLAEKFKKL